MMFFKIFVTGCLILMILLVASIFEREGERADQKETIGLLVVEIVYVLAILGVWL